MTIKKRKGLICIPRLVEQVMPGTYKNIDKVGMNQEERVVLIIYKTLISWNTLQILKWEN